VTPQLRKGGALGSTGASCLPAAQHHERSRWSCPFDCDGETISEVTDTFDAVLEAADPDDAVEVPDIAVVQTDPTQVLVGVTYACVCGSDLHPYQDLEEIPEGRRMGHEATHVVAERREEGIGIVMEITNGEGSHVVLEAVGHMPAYEQAYGIVRPGGVISRVGVPQYQDAPVGFASLFGKNVALTGEPATVPAYLEAAIPQVLDGIIDPGRSSTASCR
jgi:threonine dehydrogenase-like Zn-dependent dehydrogenase